MSGRWTILTLLAIVLCLGSPTRLRAQALEAPLPSWSLDNNPGPLRWDSLSTRSHTGTGLLIGALVGSVATALFLAGFCSDPDTQCGADEVGRAALIIAVPPALVGMLIGSLIRTRR